MKNGARPPVPLIPVYKYQLTAGCLNGHTDPILSSYVLAPIIPAQHHDERWSIAAESPPAIEVQPNHVPMQPDPLNDLVGVSLGEFSQNPDVWCLDRQPRAVSD